MSDLTIGDLIEALSGLPEDTPIRLGLQPTYPLQSHIQPEVRLYLGVAYILEDQQVHSHPYLPRWLLNGEDAPCEWCTSSHRPAVVTVTQGDGSATICQACLDELPSAERSQTEVRPLP